MAGQVQDHGILGTHRRFHLVETGEDAVARGLAVDQLIRDDAAETLPSGLELPDDVDGVVRRIAERQLRH